MNNESNHQAFGKRAAKLESGRAPAMGGHEAKIKGAAEKQLDGRGEVLRIDAIQNRMRKFT
jgi:hypothetical protein